MVPVLAGLAIMSGPSFRLLAQSAPQRLSPQPRLSFDMKTYARVDPHARAQQIEWRVRPSDAAAVRHIPDNLLPGSYVHIRCRGIRAGAPYDCAVFEAAPDDARLQAIALSFTHGLRDPYPVPEGRTMELTISFHFHDSARPDAPPFCPWPSCPPSLRPHPPAPPPAPEPEPEP
jgi:hypothetical protein